MAETVVKLPSLYLYRCILCLFSSQSAHTKKEEETPTRHENIEQHAEQKTKNKPTGKNKKLNGQNMKKDPMGQIEIKFKGLMA